jgi:hypothetical protein
VQILIEALSPKQHHQPATEFIQKLHAAPPSGSLQYSRDGGRDTFVLRTLGVQLLAAERGQIVVARATISGRNSPVCLHPTLDQHPLQARIEGTFFDLKHILTDLLDGTGDLESVKFTAAG